MKFLGKEIRGIRTLYSRIRKAIGGKKVKHGAKVLDRIDRESRKVNYILHKASRKIVDRAKELMEEGLKPIIVYGDLKNVRKPRVKWKTRCRMNNRKVHTMPSYKIKHMLTYKALCTMGGNTMHRYQRILHIPTVLEMWKPKHRD